MSLRGIRFWWLVLLALLACSTLAGAQKVKLAPTALAFGNQLVNAASSSKSITLTNTDVVSSLAISSIEASGNYAQTNNCGNSVAPGAKCTITVTFTPTVAGAITGAITLMDNAANSPQLDNLSGTGIYPLSFTPTSLSFGTVSVGNTSAAKIITLTNNRDSAMSLSFNASGNFAVSGSGTTCTASLGPKASCAIAVTFAPTTIGTIKGALTLIHDAGFSPREACLTGTGSGSATASLKIAPVSLSFTSVVGVASAAKVATITNASASPVTINSISASSVYSWSGSGGTPCAPGPLAAGAKCTLAVTYTPTVSGANTGAVTISYTGSSSPQMLKLSGKSLMPVTFSPTSLTFSAQPVGVPSPPKTVTLTNNQSAALALTSIVTSGQYGIVSAGSNPCGNSVPAKGTCTIGVAFTPVSAATIKGVVTIAHDALFSPQEIKLTGTGKAAATVARFAIFPDNDYKTLSVYSIDAGTGKMRPNGQRLVGPDLYTNPSTTVVHPSGKFVYTDAGFVGIYGYTVNADGSLSPVPGSPFSASRPGNLAIAPNGKFFYMLDSVTLRGFTVNASTGSLTQISGMPSITFSGRAMTFDPATKYLYAQVDGGYEDTTILVFAIDSGTGVLTSVQSILAPGTGRSSGMAVDPSGKFLYATGFDNGAVDGFTINSATGELTLIAGSPFVGGYPGESLSVDPLGKYVYAGNRGGVAMYTINSSTGALSEVAGSPFLTSLGELGSIAPDPTGKFLYIDHNWAMTAVAVDRSADTLTVLNTVKTRSTSGSGRWSRFQISTGPTALSYTPKFAYVLNNTANSVSSYTINATSGVLTQVGSAVATGGNNPQAMATDWFGKFLYVVNQDSSTVSAFKVNPTTGALSVASGSPYATGPAPTGVAVETSGRFVYVANSGDESVTIYSIDPTTGGLTQAGMALGIGQCTGARSLTVDWKGRDLYEVCSASNKTLQRSMDAATGLLSTPQPFAHGGISFNLSPYGAAAPHSTYWHSYAYQVIPADQAINQFLVGNVGDLYFVSAGPTGVNQGMILDPLNRFAYAANSTANNIRAYTIDPAAGTLTQVAGSPWGAGTFPVAAAEDATGRFLYVVNRDSNTVSGFTIGQSTGALTAMSPPTFNTGEDPVQILTTWTLQ